MKQFYMDTIERMLSSEIRAQLELELYSVQCEENYQLDIKKMIFNDNTIIILGAFDNDLFRKKVQNKQKNILA